MLPQFKLNVPKTIVGAANNNNNHANIKNTPSFKDAESLFLKAKNNSGENGKKNRLRLRGDGGWLKALMFGAGAVIILYVQAMTRDMEKVSDEDIGLIYTLYTCSVLLLAGMSVIRVHIYI
jgi:hypothetical protein